MQDRDAFVCVKWLHSNRLIKTYLAKGKRVDTAGTDMLLQNTLQSVNSVQMLQLILTARLLYLPVDYVVVNLNRASLSK